MLLEMFPKSNDMRILELKDSYERLRKGQYAKITNLNGRIEHLEKEVEFLKSYICKNLLFEIDDKC